MRIWRPVRSLGGVIGLLTALALGVGVVWLARMLPAPVSGWTFWFALGVLFLASLGALFLYWGIAFFTLRYRFDRNGLILYWGGSWQVIPMNRVTEIRRRAEGERIREWGLRWPGFHRGSGRSAGLGVVEFYATAGRRAQVLVCTADRAWVLSPRNPDEFIQEMEIRRSLGITRQLPQERQYWWAFGWSIWRDRLLWAVGGLALIANFSLFALLCHRYQLLSPLMPIHFVEDPGAGIIADIIGQKQDLFKLPAFGLLIFGGNLVLEFLLHRRQRALALFLAVIGLLVQVVFWLGALFILFYRRGG